jgi:hypothetical protein
MTVWNFQEFINAESCETSIMKQKFEMPEKDGRIASSGKAAMISSWAIGNLDQSFALA